jgi:hypothetical protein
LEKWKKCFGLRVRQISIQQNLKTGNCSKNLSASDWIAKGFDRKMQKRLI